MASTNHVTTRWMGDMAFESNNPSGLTFRIEASPDEGGKGEGLRPKALMLSSLAGCSGLDVAFLIRKMKLEVGSFHIDIHGRLTDSQPQTYEHVSMEFHFFGDRLHKAKLERAAIDHLVANDFQNALVIYQKLESATGRPVYSTMVRILKRRTRTFCSGDMACSSL